MTARDYRNNDPKKTRQRPDILWVDRTGFQAYAKNRDRSVTFWRFAMAMGRISVPFSSDERGALIKIAELECRDPRDQVRYLVREEAQRRGLIPADEQKKGRLTGDKHTKDDQDSAFTPES